MRQGAEPAGRAPSQKSCPRCAGAGKLVVPGKTPLEQSVYGCPACGFCFTAEGKQFADNLKELKDFFRGATLGQKTLAEGLKDVDLPPGARVLMMAQIIEYGTTMWFDGLKQGLLLGALDRNYKEKTSGDGEV